MNDRLDLTGLEAALVLEGLDEAARRRILNRIGHGAPADLEARRLRAHYQRVIGASLLGFGPPSGELLGQEAAAMFRSLWAAPGVQQVDRLWLEWNVLPPPGELPATLMRLAAEISYQDPESSPGEVGRIVELPGPGR